MIELFSHPAIRPLLVISVLAMPGVVQAHFQELIPNTDIVEQGDGTMLTLQMQFTHPMAGGPVMGMGEPVRFGVLTSEGDKGLKPSLEAAEREGQQVFTADYAIESPGDHVFYLEPAPYWEPAEGVMIVHYTKVVVNAFGKEDSWDAEVGFPVEITPLVRPYGLWTGNLFRGVVMQDGEPVPFAEVEVEWRNDGSVEAPADPFLTQVIRADAGGVFNYAMPREGWWGFAALLEGDSPMVNPDGEQVEVENGALIWVHTRDMH